MSTHLDILILTLFLESPIDEFDSLNNIKDRQLVLVLHVRATLIRIHLFGHGTGLVLDKIKCFHHELGSRSSMNADRQHADYTASQAVVKTES